MIRWWSISGLTLCRGDFRLFPIIVKIFAVNPPPILIIPFLIRVDSLGVLSKSLTITRHTLKQLIILIVCGGVFAFKNRRHLRIVTFKPAPTIWIRGRWWKVVRPFGAITSEKVVSFFFQPHRFWRHKCRKCNCLFETRRSIGQHSCFHETKRDSKAKNKQSLACCFKNIDVTPIRCKSNKPDQETQPKCGCE